MFKWLKVAREKNDNYRHVAYRKFSIIWSNCDRKEGHIHYDLYESATGRRKMITSTSGCNFTSMNNYIKTSSIYKRVVLPWLNHHVKYPGAIHENDDLWKNTIGYDNVCWPEKYEDEVEIEIDPIIDEKDNVVTVDFERNK